MTGRRTGLWAVVWLIGVLATGCGAPPVTPGDEPPLPADEIAALRAATADSPGDLRAWLRLAKLELNANGDRDAALAIAQECVTRNPDLPTAYIVAAEIAIQASAPSQARRFVRLYLGVEPFDPRGYLVLADLERNDADAAEAVFDAGIRRLAARAAAADPDAPPLPEPSRPEFVDPPPPLPGYNVDPALGADRVDLRTLRAGLGQLAFNRAQLQVLAGRLKPALADLAPVAAHLEAVGAQDGQIEIAEFLARLEAATGDTDAALRRLRRLLGADPSQPQLIETLTWLRLTRGQPAVAILDLTDLLQRTESPAARLAIYLNLGYTEVLRGDPEAARSHAGVALQIAPRSKSAWLLRYQVMQVLGDDRLPAVADNLAAERIAPYRLPRQLATLQACLRGVFWQYLLEPDRAREAFEAAHAGEPTPWSAVALAELAAREGDLRRAIEWYERAVDDPALAAEIHCSIGDCHLRLGNPVAAERAYEAALAVAPTSARAKRGRALAQAAGSGAARRAAEAAPPEPTGRPVNPDR
jgi:tetratricopeptide (TPR) repeat protein